MEMSFDEFTDDRGGGLSALGDNLPEDLARLDARRPGRWSSPDAATRRST
jgi:hypothetical protein